MRGHPLTLGVHRVNQVVLLCRKEWAGGEGGPRSPGLWNSGKEAAPWQHQVFFSKLALWQQSGRELLGTPLGGSEEPRKEIDVLTEW